MNNNIKKRIDNLGRIVLPKQIREELKISDFDELCIHVDGDSIVLKKSIGLAKFKEQLARLLKLIKLAYKIDVIISDGEFIVSSSHDNINYNDQLINFVWGHNYKNEVVELNINNNIKISSYVVVENLIIDSNLVGYVVFFSNDSLNYLLEEINNLKKIILDLIY